MARLIVNPGSAAAWEIPLKLGVNALGRGLANDFKLTDPSISTNHCQITITPEASYIKDLGSTNGTYVNRMPVKEATLHSGQTIHLGGLEMMFHADQPAEATMAPSSASVSAVPANTSRIRVSLAPPRLAEEATATPETMVARPTPPPLGATPAPAGAQNCKHHPKSPGRYLCPQCRARFCELCVSPRMVGGAQHKFCRHCGAECAVLEVHVTPPAQKRFFPSLPGVFIYPFRGSGLLILLVATVVFAALERFRGIFSILMTITAIGYLFSFMQGIIHSTAAEEREMPELPGLDDVFASCFRLLGCVVISFGLAIAVGCVAALNEDLRPTAMIALIPAMAFGGFYFPMALLAVAMKDSVAAANPLVVMPAIFKVPLEYLVTVILLGAAFGFRVLGGIALTVFAGDEFTTDSMSKLLLTLGLSAFWSFFVVYLLTVNMRTLGLLYLTKKDKLGWFNH